MRHLGSWVVEKRKIILPVFALVSILLVMWVPKNQLNDVFVNYFDESVEFRVDTDYATKYLTGTYTIDYSLDSGATQQVSDPKFLQQVEDFANWYREQPEVLHVTSITDTFKRLNRNMHGDDLAWYKLPENNKLAAQYLLLYEMSLPYGLDLNNQIDLDKRTTRMSVILKTISSSQILALEERANAWLKANTPNMVADGASPAVMFSHIGMRNIQSMLTGTTIALVLISGVLIFSLRSFKYGIISLIPNILPAAMAFGIWAIFVGEIGLSLSIVTAMTLGIVVDDTVHFISKYMRARHEKDLDSMDAVRFKSVTMNDSYHEVMNSVLSALEYGFPVKLNMVVLQGLGRGEIIEFVKLARDYPLEVRFLEFMPLCGAGWQPDLVLPIQTLRSIVNETYTLHKRPRNGNVAESFSIENGKGSVGFIASLTESFCDQCSRIRLSANGEIQPCLFSNETVSVRALLRSGASDGAIEAAIRQAAKIKSRGNIFQDRPFTGHERGIELYQKTPLIRFIGG